MKKIILVLAVLGLLGGCVSLPKLDDHQLPLAPVMEAGIYLNQTELEIETPNTNAPYVGGGALGGLIGALISSAIDNSMAKSAEKAIEPVRNALIESNTEQEVIETARRILQDNRFASRTLIETYIFDKIPKPDDLPVEAAKDQLSVQLSYKLTNDLRLLIVSASVSWYDVSVKEGGRKSKRHIDAHYHNYYTYLIEAPERIEQEDLTRREEYAQSWSRLGGTEIHKLIVQGVVDVMELLLLDLESLGNPDFTAQTVRFLNGSGIRVKGNVIKSRGDQVWVKTKTGISQAYYSVGTDALKYLSH